MKIDVFKHYTDSYSADLSRWPEELVKPALAFIETSPAAKAYFDEALKIDTALRTLEGRDGNYQKLEAGIMQKIASTPQERKPVPQQERSFRPAWVLAPGSGLLAAVVIGFFVGFQPQLQADYILDPVFYAEEQIIGGDDADIFNEEVF